MMFKNAVLETDRLIIRPTRLEDDTGLHAIVSQDEVMRFLPEAVMSLSEVRHIITWLLKCYDENTPQNIKKWTLAVVLTGQRTHITIDDLDERFEDHFTLWIPIDNQPDNSVAGVLMDRKEEKTSIWMVGMEKSLGPDDRGWNPLLNGNTVLHVWIPEGEQVAFDLTEIEDVRKLEKMGYNFWLMEFDTPGQIPIPGMGPRLNKIDPNPFTDATIIRYMVPQAYEVQVQILDEHRREVCTLLDCIALAGIREVAWGGRDADGNRVEPGTYLCRFIAGDYVETQKIKLEP